MTSVEIPVAARTRVLLVDDHAIVRDTLGDLLGREPDIEIVATAPDADQAIKLALDLRPHVIVSDIDMPGVNCFDACGRIKAALPAVGFIFLSAYCRDFYIDQALRLGARGYLTKGDSPAALIEAIREVARDGVYFSPDVQARLMVTEGGVALAQTAEVRGSTLTEREVEVLQYLARGLRKKDIASVMKLSIKTVERHCENMMTKLDIHDRVELTRYALREGLAV